jgi:hypothetical protein
MTDKRRIGPREIATLGQTGTACLKCANSGSHRDNRGTFRSDGHTFDRAV